MEGGTYAYRLNLAVGKSLRVNIPIDVVIKPKKAPRSVADPDRGQVRG